MAPTTTLSTPPGGPDSEVDYFGFPNLSEITIIDQNGKEYLCHKTALASGSDLFAEAFSSGGKWEKNEKLELCDSDATPIEIMLKWLYDTDSYDTIADSLDWTGRIDLDVYTTARNYGIPDLATHAIARLRHDIESAEDIADECVQNLWQIYFTHTAFSADDGKKTGALDQEGDEFRPMLAEICAKHIKELIEDFGFRMFIQDLPTFCHDLVKALMVENEGAEMRRLLGLL